MKRLLLLIASVCLAWGNACADDFSFGGGTRAVWISPAGRRASGSTSIDSDLKPEVVLQYSPARIISLEYGLLYSRHSFIYGSPPRGTGAMELLTQNLTVLLHPFSGKMVDCYVGAGGNLMVPGETASTEQSFAIDTHAGWTIQAGINLKLTPAFWLNFDYRRLDMDTTATIDGRSYRFDISPDLYSFGILFRR